VSNYKHPKQYRIARTSLLALLAVCGLVAISCRRSPEVNSNGDSASEVVTSSTPPFATKETELYQAIRTTTFTESSSNPGPSPSETRTSRVVIGRDGDKRREEYEAGTGQIVSLEIPAGRFVLLPASKVYAELSAGVSERLNEPPDQFPNVSPDSLLNETPAAAKYQRLTTETLAGRATTKYRVTTTRDTDETAVTVETLVWIDEALGMPIKSEFLSNEADRSTRVTMELKDIRLDVDERLFGLPADYRRVEASVIFELIRKGVKAAAPK
jgi:outer membrane lipoprotein-sorting protein